MAGKEGGEASDVSDEHREGREIGRKEGSQAFEIRFWRRRAVPEVLPKRTLDLRVQEREGLYF